MVCRCDSLSLSEMEIPLRPAEHVGERGWALARLSPLLCSYMKVSPASLSASSWGFLEFPWTFTSFEVCPARRPPRLRVEVQLNGSDLTRGPSARSLTTTSTANDLVGTKECRIRCRGTSRRAERCGTWVTRWKPT